MGAKHGRPRFDVSSLSGPTQAHLALDAAARRADIRLHRRRCRNSNHPSFRTYRGRGIVECKRWFKFENFLADMREPVNPKHTLERIHINKGYEPRNCAWKGRVVQARNTRRNRLLTIFDETYCLAEWSERTGIPAWKIRRRLNHSWPTESSPGRDPADYE